MNENGNGKSEWIWEKDQTKNRSETTIEEIFKNVILIRNIGKENNLLVVDFQTKCQRMFSKSETSPLISMIYLKLTSSCISVLIDALIVLLKY